MNGSFSNLWFLDNDWACVNSSTGKGAATLWSEGDYDSMDHVTMSGGGPYMAYKPAYRTRVAYSWFSGTSGLQHDGAHVQVAKGAHVLACDSMC